MDNKISNFIELTRLKKPIGFMLLFWPCVWGLTLAYDFNSSIIHFFKFIILFLCGSILMRSAGCIINDIVDKNFDIKVERTKTRPIASGKISIKLGIIYALLLCFVALLVLLNFNNFTIILAFCSMPLAFTYPYIKRFSHWPQLYLGITFNFGLLLGWTAVFSEISIQPIIFYLGAIFWTLGYDTVYGYQDIKDDEIIGVKSTSILFKKNPKMFIFFSYLLFVIFYLFTGFLMKFSVLFFLIALIPITHLVLQLIKFNSNEPLNCLKIFKSNNQFGLLIFINLIIEKVQI